MREAASFSPGSYESASRLESQSAGSSREMSCLNSAASSGYFSVYSASVAFHSASSAAPRSVWSKAALTSSGTTKGSCSHLSMSRVAATSSVPSAAPCTSCELALLGEP